MGLEKTLYLDRSASCTGGTISLIIAQGYTYAQAEKQKVPKPPTDSMVCKLEELPRRNLYVNQR